MNCLIGREPALDVPTSSQKSASRPLNDVGSSAESPRDPHSARHGPGAWGIPARCCSTTSVFTTASAAPWEIKTGLTARVPGLDEVESGASAAGDRVVFHSLPPPLERIGTAARGPFDDIMERVAAPTDVTFEADTVGGVSGLWAKPARPRKGAAIIHVHRRLVQLGHRPHCSPGGCQLLHSA